MKRFQYKKMKKRNKESRAYFTMKKLCNNTKSSIDNHAKKQLGEYFN